MTTDISTNTIFQRISENIYVFPDTCNVYIVRNGASAVLIDFGSGEVMEHLASIGVSQVTDVLITHHHRDQCQGLPIIAGGDIKIWVPHTEQDLFHSVDAQWLRQDIYNNYDVRQNRFSLLEPVPISGTLWDYSKRTFNDLLFQVIPTPGHTMGSISLFSEVDGQKVAFTGDLIGAPGKVWSLAATQWSYNGAEGVAASVASLLDMKERQPDLLLPSHGQPIPDPQAAMDLLIERFWKLLQYRKQNPRLFELRKKPYEAITPHLLVSRASMSNFYVLLSDSGRALFIDFGYDFITGIPVGSDRASRRPWLYTIPMLKEQFGVKKIDAVLPTHYHDDHVAGCNLLRLVEGTEVWASETFADILEEPACFDLPCLWYDPIAVDRRIPLYQSIQWQEYTLTLHPLRGHTRYAVAIEFVVDGAKVLATGDQYQNNDGFKWNYVYKNRYSIGDYTASAKLYQSLKPELILPGHWNPLWVREGYFERLVEDAVALEQLQTDLMLKAPTQETEDFVARIQPYQMTVKDWEIPLSFDVEIHNPFPEPKDVRLKMVIPANWKILSDSIAMHLTALETRFFSIQVIPPAHWKGRRERLAVDVTIGSQHFGQQAEALVSSM